MSLSKIACSPTTATTRSATTAPASGAMANATAAPATDLRQSPSFTARLLTHPRDPIDQARRSREDQGVEQVLLVDESEGQGLSVDLQADARVVESEAVRALIAGDLPKPFG